MSVSNNYLGQSLSSRFSRCLKILLLASSLLASASAVAEVTDELIVEETSQGYKIEAKFNTPLSLISVAPDHAARVFEIMLQPQNIAEENELDVPDEREEFNWDRSLKSPLREAVFDEIGANEQHQLTLTFSEKVEISVATSSDLRAVIINVISDKASEPGAKVPVKVSRDLLSSLKADNAEQQKLIGQARQAFLAKKYRDAIRYLSKLRDTSSGQVQIVAYEMLGVAREYNGQLAHAKREYEQFIASYPDTAATPRVRQRLTSLITAARVLPPSVAGQPVRAKGDKKPADDGWKVSTFGSIAQKYFRNETKDDAGETELITDEVISSLSYTVRAKRDDIEVKARFVGDYKKNFLDSSDDQFRPSIASVELKMKDAGIFGTVGRQSRSTGGVLGRFDGLHAAYDLNETVTVNAVYGHPVITSEKDSFNSDQRFYGTSVDFNDLFEGWNFSAFYITEDYFGVKNREAIGGEVRYLDAKRSMFATVDYDIHFDKLNTFLFLGSWKFTDKTRMNMTLDYRNSPILTMASAYSVYDNTVYASLEDMFDGRSEDEIRAFALATIPVTKTATVSLTHDVNDRWQLVADVTATNTGSTDGVVADTDVTGADPLEATSTDMFYNAQLIANGLFYDNDIMILGSRYADTASSDTYTLTGNWRVNPNKKLRVNPRVRVDYKEGKDDGFNTITFKPSLRMDYKLTKKAKLEFEGAYEWETDEQSTGDANTENSYLSLGYRVQF